MEYDKHTLVSLKLRRLDFFPNALWLEFDVSVCARYGDAKILYGINSSNLKLITYPCTYVQPKMLLSPQIKYNILYTIILHRRVRKMPKILIL